MAKKTILVIEDEEKLRRVIGLHLAGAGYEVKAAGTAEEGWKLADAVDLVLTDMKLPGMDGLELLEKLKAAGVEAKAAASSIDETVALQALGSNGTAGNGTPAAAQLKGSTVTVAPPAIAETAKEHGLDPRVAQQVLRTIIDGFTLLEVEELGPTP